MNSIFTNYLPNFVEEAWSGMTGNPNVILCVCERGALDMKEVQKALNLKFSTTKWKAVAPIKGGFQIYYPEGLSHKIKLKDYGSAINLMLTSNIKSPVTWSTWFTHLPTKKFSRSWDISSTNEAQRFRELVESSEKGVAGTVCLGDFNTNPYDIAMSSPTGLNAVMCRNVARRKIPNINKNGKEIGVKWFFNPMWSLMGDQLSGKQPGSFCLKIEESDSRFWVMPDQVIIRPGNAQSIQSGWPKIFSYFSNSGSLINNGPRGFGGINDKISDHLPIGVMLNI